jgi:NTP pyrophosphatase (non-canonical NTP hydrolase)
MNYAKNRSYVLKNTDRRTLLEQLAEEAAELSQAALKLIRAEGLSNNHTNRNTLIAQEQLNDEVADVLMMVDALRIPVLESYANDKWQRWADRIKEYLDRRNVTNVSKQ